MSKILIVDDMPDNLVAISAMIRALIPGTEVITAGSGAEGINRTRTESPDVVLLDVKMPEMSGYDVCRRLKAEKTTAHIPIIMLTAIKTVSEDMVEGLESGADAYLTKPIDEQLLMAQIRTALRIKTAEDALRDEKQLLEKMVSERTRELRDREVLYRSLVEYSTDHIFLLDLNGRYLSSNNRQVRCGLLKDESMVGLHLKEAHPIEIADDLQKKLADVIATRKAIPFEQSLENANGRHHHIGTLYPVYRDGVLWAVGGVCRDITELKNYQETVENQWRFLREVIDASPNFVFVKDTSARIILANRRLADNYGTTPAEMIGKTVKEIMQNPEVAEAAFKNDMDILSGRLDRIEKEERYTDRSGQLLWAYTVKGPLTDGTGRIVGLIGVSTDITDRKKEEEARTALESKLRQAQKMEAIGTLAGGIAHDFNNILSSIIGYTELAIDEAGPDTSLRRNLQQVLSAGARAGDLVKQILTFSRQSEQVSTPFQVKLLIKESLKLLRASLPTTIEIKENIRSDDVIIGDPVQIQQIVMNLATNALYAMQDNGGILSVKLESANYDADAVKSHPDMRPGAYIRLTVSDTGCGIPPNALDKIFDPFFTTKPEGKGTGLGLSVVHGIVKNHGGILNVSSIHGSGTSFEILFPAADFTESSNIEIDAPIPTGSESILFVDDEPALIGLGEKMLASLGYRTETRTSSIEALEAFRGNPDRYDLIITDMTMPHMTGDALSEAIKEIRPDIPIILCTGFSERIREEDLDRIGIADFILKPINRRELARAIRKALDEKSG